MPNQPALPLTRESIEEPINDSAHKRRAVPNEPMNRDDDRRTGMEGDSAECRRQVAGDAGSTEFGYVRPAHSAGSAEDEYARPAAVAGSKEMAGEAEYLRPAKPPAPPRFTVDGPSVLPFGSAHAVYQARWLSGDRKLSEGHQRKKDCEGAPLERPS